MPVSISNAAFIHVVSKDGTKVTMTYDDVCAAVIEWEKQTGRAACVGDTIPLCNLADGDHIVVDSFDSDNATVSIGIRKP